MIIMSDKFKWMKKETMEKKIGIDVPDHYAIRSQDGTLYHLIVDNNGVIRVKKILMKKAVMEL